MGIEIPDSVKVWSQAFHPIFMWVLLAGAGYALYLGWQARRGRTTDDKALRKQLLIERKSRDKHHQIGSALLALVTLGCLGGMAVTYINNGRLFLGPHLLAGLGMVGMLTIAAALTPLMQQGHEWARNTHIALNLAMLGIFGWQAVSGMQIVAKILNKL
ncbi:hypothetical protein KR51_00024610 [Rubidibacter lacunae KORDI 51-2]|uniref:DUF4079 domain-containing protein n=1 Tax=Rubidibacter lacunae KORDI 51-2 TaxID=582515 RepID=U5DJ45_9CHRO|nr:DUF4079 domain-containing protein [Rubidibacter lacunae]ERN40957.1 hypothetical protein KR51_00024610 [Rubidibacter lacunae KORDI 51-2]